MAFSQTSLLGHNEYGCTTGDEEFLLPGDPGVSFAEGDLCCIDRANANGVLIKATDSLPPPYFRVTRATVCPASTQPFPKPPSQYNPGQAEIDKCLIPCTWVGNKKGMPILRSKLNGYVVTDAVVSYTASTRAVAMTTGFNTDDYPNGALCYCVAGPGAGELNIVEDYDHADGAAALLVIFHRKWDATLTTSSELLFLCPAAADNGVGPFGRMDVYDVDELDVADGSNDGNFIVFGGWEKFGDLIKHGHLPVVQYNVE
jgi:hypothetical protein